MVRKRVACGLSVVLASCTTDTAQQNNRPTRFLSVQPIQVCNSFGIFCADLALFEDETDKIWSQANIDITFLEPVQLNATRFLTIDSDDEFAELSFSGGIGAFGRHPLSTRTSGPINMWFVEQITRGLFDTLGLAWIDQNGILISDNILDFNNGIGRLDTVAHEIGHNLGLTHSNFGAGPATNLMSDGGIRNVPSALGDINPDGAQLSQLTTEQINFARDSSLVTSSPGLSGGGEATQPPPILPPFLDAVPIQLSNTASNTASWQPSETIALADSSPVPESSPESAVTPVGKPADSAGTMFETTPLGPSKVSTDFLVVNHSRQPQQIPNGPAMSLISAGILIGFMGLQRQQNR
jgi:hypothetical protein